MLFSFQQNRFIMLALIGRLEIDGSNFEISCYR